MLGSGEDVLLSGFGAPGDGPSFVARLPARDEPDVRLLTLLLRLPLRVRVSELPRLVAGQPLVEPGQLQGARPLVRRQLRGVLPQPPRQLHVLERVQQH